MKHAGPRTLDTLEPMLKVLRKIPGLIERTRGVFYRGGSSFLHFHEDPAGIFADLRTGENFRRYRVNSKRELYLLMRAVRTAVSAAARAEVQ